jgi:hypothetical protein
MVNIWFFLEGIHVRSLRRRRSHPSPAVGFWPEKNGAGQGREAAEGLALDARRASGRTTGAMGVWGNLSSWLFPCFPSAPCLLSPNGPDACPFGAVLFSRPHKMLSGSEAFAFRMAVYSSDIIRESQHT